MESQTFDRRALLRLRRRWRRKLGWAQVGDWICFVEADAIRSEDGRATKLEEWERVVRASGLAFEGRASPEKFDVTVTGRGKWWVVDAKVRLLDAWLRQSFHFVNVSNLFDAKWPKPPPGEDAGEWIKELIGWRRHKR